MKKILRGFTAIFLLCLLFGFMQTNTNAADKDDVNWDAILKVPAKVAKEEANPDDQTF